MLLKNVVKTLRGKWMQLIAIGLIIILSSCTYTMMFYGLSGIEQPTREYLVQCNQEDFSVEMLNTVTQEEARYPVLSGLIAKGFYSLSDIKKAEPSTFYQLMDNRVKEFQKIYGDFSVELRESKDAEYEHGDQSHKALILKDAGKINLSYMEEGTKPVRDDEIAVSRIYAVKNSIGIGDSLMIKGRQYKVTGFVLFPDYTLPMFGDSFNLDTGMQTLILMSDAGYESFDGKESFRLSGVSLTGETIDTAFDSEKLPFVTQIIPTKSNMRSGAIYEELNQGKVMALGLSIFIASIAVIIVAILMYNLLHAERGQIGILKALGYRRLQIAVPYFLAMQLVAFAMLIVGYVLGAIYAEPLKSMYLDFYLLPSVKIGQSVLVFATAIFAPLLFFAAVTWAIIYRMLGESPLKLMKPPESRAINRLSRWISRLLVRAKGSTKFKYLHAVRSTGTFLIFFLGIMFSTILITYSFTMTGMVDRMTVDYLDRVDYQYESYADFTKRIPQVRQGDEKFLTYPYASLDGEIVTLQGLEPRNNLYRLYNDQGEDLTASIRTGAVITKGLSIKTGLRAGDTITVKVYDDTYSFPVEGIVDAYISDTVYLDLETLSGMVSQNKSSGLYSGIYSLEKPSSEYYSTIISKQGIIDQSKAMSSYTSFMVRILIGGSALIAASILFTLTSFTVEKNYYAISLLKVMGYQRREVTSMILDSYFIYSVLSYLLSVPIALGLMNWMTTYFAAEYGVVIPLEFRWIDMLKSLAIFILIFQLGTYASRIKIRNIPLQEVLKSYGE